MKITNKRVFVTGGAGFIGSHLVEALLKRNNWVTVFDNFATGKRTNLPTDHPRIKIIEGDVRNLDSLYSHMANHQVVFHLATHCVRLSLSDPKSNHECNSTGTLNVLLASNNANVERFIYCSSSEVYGNTIRHESKLDENSPKIPTTIYGGSKLAGEHYTLAFQQTYGLSSMVVRPFNTYGPRSHIEGPYGEVIPRFAILLSANRPATIFGDGRQARDFTYVEDTAKALVECAQTDAFLGTDVNIGSGEVVSINELFHLLRQHFPTSPKPRHCKNRPGDIRKLHVDNQKFQSYIDLKWTPIKDGLATYLNYLRDCGTDFQAIAARLTQQNWNIASTSAEQINHSGVL